MKLIAKQEARVVSGVFYLTGYVLLIIVSVIYFSRRGRQRATFKMYRGQLHEIGCKHIPAGYYS